jgi:hypothetical protein
MHVALVSYGCIEVKGEGLEPWTQASIAPTATESHPTPTGGPASPLRNVDSLAPARLALRAACGSLPCTFPRCLVALPGQTFVFPSSTNALSRRFCQGRYGPRTLTDPRQQWSRGARAPRPPSVAPPRPTRRKNSPACGRIYFNQPARARASAPEPSGVKKPRLHGRAAGALPGTKALPRQFVIDANCNLLQHSSE